MKFPAPVCLFAFGVLLAGCQHAPPPRTAAQAPVLPPNHPPTATSSYLFGWGDVPSTVAQPRGGTSRGSTVTLAPPQSLPLPAIASAASAFERDRAAILALAGDYKTSFHFLETLGLTPDSAPSRPYHSWATEHIRVIEDTGRFITLQHTLVMFFQQADGTASAPMLQKHWRQDWTYEDTDLHTFRGERTWARRQPAPDESAGAWSQAVFQVDDSPRYEALGRWSHDGNRSLWTSEIAWRPLPRRESSTRHDYDVIEGRHQILITPTGWVHAQDNWKRIAGETVPAAPPRYLAHESGLDRYERIATPSLAAADAEWSRTAPYWSAVRHAWRDIFAAHDHFSLRPTVDGQRLFELHFAYAAELAAGRAFDPADAARHARETIAGFLVP